MTILMNNLLTGHVIDKWMSRLLRQAYCTGAFNEVPVTAIILNELGCCIGWGRNSREKDQDPMGHAELIALRQASHFLNNWRFNQCTMIVTLEPCIMCTGALLQARMSTVIYAASDYKRGGLGGAMDLSKHKSAHHKIDVVSGVRSKESCELLEIWFRRKRLSQNKLGY